MPTTVNDLTINNASGVSLTNSVTTNGTLNLNSGALNLNGNTLTIPSSGLVSCGGGTINGNAGSSAIFNNTSPTYFPAGTYQNVTLNTSGGLTMCGNATVNGILTMTSGNISTGSNILLLSNSAVGALTYTSGTVIGKLERYIGSTLSSYLFPVGRATQTQTLTSYFTDLTPGSLLVEFIPGDPGSSWTSEN